MTLNVAAGHSMHLILSWALMTDKRNYELVEAPEFGL
jgi:hypothetical protein